MTIRRRYDRIATACAAVIALVTLIARCLAVLPRAQQESDEAQARARCRDRLRRDHGRRGQGHPASDSRQSRRASPSFPSTIKAGFIVGGMRGRGVLSARNAERLVGAGVPDADRRQLRAADRRPGGGHRPGHQRSPRPREPRARTSSSSAPTPAVAAGPVGRDAQAATDLQLRAQILSYSRARGLFAGVTVNGSTIRQDRDANERFYGKRLETTADRLRRRARPPPVTG